MGVTEGVQREKRRNVSIVLMQEIVKNIYRYLRIESECL